MPAEDAHDAGFTRGRFDTTQWSVVLEAGRPSDPGASRALQDLCEIYWYPLYAFVRRRGCEAHDAEDLTQGFFAWLLESGHLAVADPERGRFRSFLLCRLKHFLSDEEKKARAKKRGGGVSAISFDAARAEGRYDLEPADTSSPERLYDRQWGALLLERTVARLRAEYEATGRGCLFEELRQFQPGESASRTYKESATRLGLSESAVKSAIYRLRQRHREILREEIGHTVADPNDIDEEIRHLIAVLVG